MIDLQIAERWWTQEEPILWKNILRRVGNRADAEEVLQDVKIVFFSEIVTLPQSQWAPRTRTVAKNMAIDRFRAMVKSRLGESLEDTVLVITKPSPTPSPERVVGWKMLLEKIGECLSAEEFEVLIMDSEGYTAEEIGKHLGCSSTYAGIKRERVRQRVMSFSFVQRFRRARDVS